MAIKLEDKPQVNSPNPEYPYGEIRDDSSSGADDGTPVNKLVYGDMHQFFASLMANSIAIGGADYNDQPENAYDGFQYYQAMVNIITFAINLRALTETTANWTDITLTSPWVAQTSYLGTVFHPPQYYRDPWGFVHLRGRAIRSNTTDGKDTVLGVLPTGYVPSEEERHVVDCNSSGGDVVAQCKVQNDGDIIVSAKVDLIMNGGGYYLVLDGVNFKTDVAP